MLICKPGLFTVHRNCTAEVYVLNDSEGGRKSPFFTKYKPQVNIFFNFFKIFYNFFLIYFAIFY